MKVIKTASLIAITLALSACADPSRFTDRTALLHSSGPQFNQADIADYKTAISNMRSLYGELGVVRTTPDGTKLHYLSLDTKTNRPTNMTQLDLWSARIGIFSYIDHQCDAYIDAIFWANRSRRGLTSGNNAIAGATGAIVGATGGSATALAVLAAAFGLSGNLFDSYYDSVLYDLEPSGIQHLVNEARTAYRARSELNEDIISEGTLLKQAQGYLRVCTPSHIEFMVNQAVKDAGVKVTDEVPDILLDFGDFALRKDGTVTGPNNAVFAPFDELPAGAGFTLEDNGAIGISGQIKPLGGTWKKPAELTVAPDVMMLAPPIAAGPVRLATPAPVAVAAPVTEAAPRGVGKGDFVEIE